jgi:glycosyltransferase involved in cell wall biosynthesis
MINDSITSPEPQTRESIVVVSPWLYHPTCGNGGGVLCFNLIQRLAAAYDVHFISFDQTSNDLEGGRRALNAFCSSVTTVPVPTTIGKAELWLRQIFTGEPREAQALNSALMSAQIRAAVSKYRPAVVILQFPQTAQYMAAAGRVPVVMDVQDACMVSRYREWRKTAPSLKRWGKLITWLAWARYERYWYSRASALLAISENDYGVLNSFIPDVPCFFSPVATDIAPLKAASTRTYVGFIGNFAHAPNRDALDWLLNDIWPRVRTLHPDAELRIAGPHVPEHARSDTSKGINVVGFVDDIDDFYAKAAMAVVPYRFGGGVKIKALEAMANGCAVVATTVGAEGLKIEKNKHLLVADGPEEFATAIASLLASEEKSASLASAARHHIETNFSWKAKTSALIGVFQSIGNTTALTSS